MLNTSPLGATMGAALMWGQGASSAAHREALCSLGGLPALTSLLRRSEPRRCALFALEIWDKCFHTIEPASEGFPPSSKLQRIATRLLLDPSPTIRSLACRIISRQAALANAHALADLSVPRLLLEQLDLVLAELFEASMLVRASGVSAAGEQCNVGEESGGMRGGGGGAQENGVSLVQARRVSTAVREESRGEQIEQETKEACEGAECSSSASERRGESHVEVKQSRQLLGAATVLPVEEVRQLEAKVAPATQFYAAMNALLNPALAKHGLWRLLQLRFAADNLSSCRQECHFGKISRMAGTVLSNISTHTANLSLMYRAELRVKAALIEGSAEKPRNHLASSSSAPQLGCRSMRREKLPAKERYVSWLSSMMEPEVSKKKLRLPPPKPRRKPRRLPQARLFSIGSMNLQAFRRLPSMQLSKSEPSILRPQPKRVPRLHIGREGTALLAELATPHAGKHRLGTLLSCATNETDVGGERGQSGAISPHHVRSCTPHQSTLSSSFPCSTSSPQPSPRTSFSGSGGRDPLNLDLLMRCSRLDTWKLPLQQQLEQMKPLYCAFTICELMLRAMPYQEIRELEVYSKPYNEKLPPLELHVVDTSRAPHGEAEKGAFNVLNSIFSIRLYTSDASSLFTTEAVTLRAFHIDWGHCNNSSFQAWPCPLQHLSLENPRLLTPSQLSNPLNPHLISTAARRGPALCNTSLGTP
ncbi:MAG: hypothetical protein SGPRY_002486 [Prymnesium sp.]